MLLGKSALDRRETTGARGPIIEPSRLLGRLHEPVAKLRAIWNGRRRTTVRLTLPIRFDQGNVDAIHRRSAHQTERVYQLAHAALPVHVRASTDSLELKPRRRNNGAKKYVNGKVRVPACPGRARLHPPVLGYRSSGRPRRPAQSHRLRGL